MVNNDYMGCDFYQNQAQNANEAGFTTFFDTETAKYYFAYVNTVTGKVIFRSEGYPTVAAQKTGLASVIKNMTDEKRFSILEDAGSFFIILKAGNRIEIARSCPFASTQLAQNTIDTLTGKIAKVAPKAKTEKVVAAKTTIKTAKSETVAPKVVAEKVKVTKVVESKKTATTPVATATPKAAKKVETTQFASDSAYLGHETLIDEHGKTGYALFTTDAKHYFVVYNDNGSVFQRSFGFETPQARNEQFSALQNAIINEDTYQIIEENNNFKVVITGTNGQILSSSALFSSFTEAFQNTPKGWSQPTEMVGTMY